MVFLFCPTMNLGEHLDILSVICALEYRFCALLHQTLAHPVLACGILGHCL